MKTLLALVLALCLTSCAMPRCAAAAEQLPWRTFSAMAKDVTSAAPIACEGDNREGITAAVQSNGIVYRFYALVDDQGGSVFVVARIKDGKPAKLYIGHSTPDAHDTLVIDRVERFDPVKHGQSACAVLAPKRT